MASGKLFAQISGSVAEEGLFSIMERIRIGSDLPKKSGGQRASNKNIRRSSYHKGHQLYISLSFDSVRALEIHDVARHV